VSLLLSAVMLGAKATSLNAIIRTINRKQELGIRIGELKKARSSMPPKVLTERVRRATEHAPAETGDCTHPKPSRAQDGKPSGSISLCAPFIAGRGVAKEELAGDAASAGALRCGVRFGHKLRH
jgi:hypothetical protein